MQIVGSFKGAKYYVGVNVNYSWFYEGWRKMNEQMKKSQQENNDWHEDMWLKQDECWLFDWMLRNESERMNIRSSVKILNAGLRVIWKCFETYKLKYILFPLIVPKYFFYISFLWYLEKSFIFMIFLFLHA